MKSQCREWAGLSYFLLRASKLREWQRVARARRQLFFNFVRLNSTRVEVANQLIAHYCGSSNMRLDE